MKKFLILFFFHLFFLFPFSEIIPIKYYSFKDGLPSLQVWKVYKSKNGYMWFGTSAGLCRYNGYEMKVFTTENGLPNNVIFSICEDKSGRLWIGTEYGGGFFFKGKFISLKGLYGRKINDIISENNIVYLATLEGLFYYKDGKLKRIKVKNENSFYTLFESKNGDIWIGGGKKVYKFSKGKIIDITKKFNLPPFTTYSIAEKSNGDILIGTTSGLYLIDKYLKKYSKYKLFKNENFSCILMDKRKKIIWFAIWGKGLVKFKDKNNYKIYKVKNGILDPFITDMYLGEEGDVWFATRFEGVGKIYSTEDTLFTEKDGVPNSITSIVEDGNGNIWVGSIESGVSKINLNNGRIDHFTDKNGLLENHIKKIYVDTTGKIWFLSPNGITIYFKGKFKKYLIGNLEFPEPDSIYKSREGKYFISTHKGLLFFNGKKFLPIKTGQKNSYLYILCIGEGENGELLVGTRKGLFILKNKLKLEKVTINSKLSSSYVTNIYRDSTGKIFISTSNGLYILHNGTYIRFSKKNGLIGNYITFVKEDSSGKIWIATTKGLSILEKNKFKNYTIKDGLCSYNINKIYEDLNKRVWIITSKGINLYRNGKLVDINKRYGFPKSNVMDVKEDRFGILFFFCSSYILKFDGFSFQYIDITFSFNNKAIYTTCWYVDSMKNIWIGTDGGVIKHKISIPYNSTFFPSTYIEKVVIDGKTYNFSEKLRKLAISKNIKKITFYWRCNSFLNENDIRYKYMLENVDKKWSNDTSKNFATYANLIPGSYKFRIISKIRYNIYGNITFLDIKIKGIPQKYKELAAITFLLSLLLGITFLIFNNNKLRKEISKLIKELNQLSLRNEMILIKFNQNKKELNKLKRIDSISNLYNFHYFLKLFREEFFQLENNLFLLMINVDNFSQINFKYSVHTANSILREIGNEILENKVIAARFSGDLFSIILKDKENVTKIIEKLESKTYKNNIKLKFYGICLEINKEKFSSPEAALGFAFRVFKKAKRNKNNKIVFY